MVKYEKVGDLVKAYSDAGFYIHGGSPEGDYTEANDPVETGRTYTETDRKIETDEVDETKEKAAAYDILVGGAA